MKAGTVALIAAQLTWPIGIFLATEEFGIVVRLCGVLVMVGGMISAYHLSLDARN